MNLEEVSFVGRVFISGGFLACAAAIVCLFVVS